MLIDTHCHLEEKDYNDLDGLINNVFKNDVKVMIISGYDVKSSQNAIDLAHKYNNTYATVGFHPNDCGDLSDSDYEKLKEWLKDEKVVGIGEIGLDYHYDGTKKDKQQAVFKKQLEIATIYNKPVVIHNRDASSDIYEILKATKVRGIIHCFNEDIDMARKFIELGFLLGIGGIVTFKKNNLKQVVYELSLDNIVLETDSPYLTPEPFRGQKNNPSHLQLVAAAISKIKEVSYNEVAETTTLNAMRLFDFKPDL